MRTRLLEKERTSKGEKKRIIMRRRMFNRGQNERKSLLASFLSLKFSSIYMYVYIYIYVYIYRSLSLYLKRKEKEKKNGNKHLPNMKKN
jgi:hypothetical protein